MSLCTKLSINEFFHKLPSRGKCVKARWSSRVTAAVSRCDLWGSASLKFMKWHSSPTLPQIRGFISLEKKLFDINFSSSWHEHIDPAMFKAAVITFLHGLRVQNANTDVSFALILNDTFQIRHRPYRITNLRRRYWLLYYWRRLVTTCHWCWRHQYDTLAVDIPNHHTRFPHGRLNITNIGKLVDTFVFV